MARAIVLGSGMVGSVIARDLAEEEALEVAVADRSSEALSRISNRDGITTMQEDLSDAVRVKGLVEPFDVVVGALPSRFGYQTLKAMIDVGKPYCDISFMPEDAIQLDAEARKRGVTAIVDCGVAPGMSNLLAGYGYHQLDACRNIEIYVGGLPVDRHWPFEYKAGFAPSDVIEEYTRTARLVENGAIVEREALSEPELMDLPGVGTLEAFNTDGLRSLAHTLRAPFMKEKTLRYPGHIELMRILRETGLFSKEPVDVDGKSVRPLDLTSRLLFPKWSYDEGEADLTVMRVIVEGTTDGEARRMVWDLLDYYDPDTNERSMSRTTGFPAAIFARLLLQGRIQKQGVIPPELLGHDAHLVQTVLEELAARGVKYAYAAM